MLLEMNTLAAFDKNGKVVKTWNYELVCSQERSFVNIRSKCDEKGYILRVCFNDDKEVEAYSQLLLEKQLRDFSK